MAGIKISNLPALPSSAFTDVAPFVQGGTTYKGTNLQVGTLFGFDSTTHLLALNKGGTNANLTAALGAVPYSTASAFAFLAPGTSGQLFRSGGAGAPTWTTATFPATAGTSGNVLVSDGTNWSSSATTSITALGTQAQALNMGSHLINNVTDPVSAQDAATKNYVDTIAQGITVQGACVAGTTATLNATYSNGSSGVGATLTNATTLAAFSTDGVSPSANARVLVKNQSTAAQNGIYTLTTVGSGAVAWILTRSTDYDQAAEINPGDLIVIESGTTLANSSWLETATVATVGTDSINFSQFTASLPITVPNGGTGLTTTTAYGLIAGGTTATGNFQNTGAGSSGQYLRSGGASALPSWSTATIPATATGTGTFLRADGTNWLASTLTIPDTAVINTIPYASSANIWGAIAAVNSAVMISSAGGVPSMSTTLPAALTIPQPVIQGITSGSAAAAGVVGEVISATVTKASGVSLVSTAAKTVTSITLTAGQWIIYAQVCFTPSGGTTMAELLGSISLTDNTLGSDSSINESLTNFTLTFGGGSDNSFPIASASANVSGSTVYYLVADAVFAVSTLKAYGKIFAVRVR